MATGVIPVVLTFLLVLSLLVLSIEAYLRDECLVLVPGLGVLFIYVVLMDPYGYEL